MSQSEPEIAPLGEPVYSLTEAAKRMHLHHRTVTKAADAGQLQTIKYDPDSKYRYVTESELERFRREGHRSSHVGAVRPPAPEAQPSQGD